MTRFKGYRILTIQILSIVLLAGGYLSGTVTDPATLATIGTIVNIVTMALRFVTDSPVFEATPTR